MFTSNSVNFNPTTSWSILEDNNLCSHCCQNLKNGLIFRVIPACISACKWTAELNQRNQNSINHLQAVAWYTKCPISLEPQDMEENGCTGNSLVIWHEVMGLWNNWCVNLILFDFYILGYLRALVYTEKTQSAKHFFKCIINTRNTITSDTIYHVTGYLICICESITIVDNMNTFYDYEPTPSFLLVVPDL